MNKVRTWEISKVITESGEYTSVIGPNTAEHFGMETYVKVVDAKDFEKAVEEFKKLEATVSAACERYESADENASLLKLGMTTGVYHILCRARNEARQTLRELGIGANK